MYWCGIKPYITHYTQTVYRSAPLYHFDKLEFGSVLQLQYSRHLSELFI